MAETLVIRVRHRPGHVLVTVAGEVDIATVAKLRQCLAESAAGGLPVIMELDEVTFIDAAGLGALVGAARRLAAHGASLHVVCAQPRTRHLLRLTGLDRRLGLRMTRAEALAALPGLELGRAPAAHLG
jgi:anti-sigma B factor antagonist